MTGHIGKRPPPATAKQLIQEMVYPNYPTVVVINGATVELTCKICGTNAQCEGVSRFMKGVKGIQSVGQLRIEEFCDLRPISSHDQDLLELCMPPTDHPIVAIEPRNLEQSAGLQPQYGRSARDSEEAETSTFKSRVAPVARMSAAAEVEDDVDMKGLFSDSEESGAHHSGEISVYEPQKDRRSSSSQPRQINPSFPTIVLLNGIWVELSCKFCDANFSRNKNRYMSGVPGILHHVRLAHAGETTSSDFDQSCNIRHVSARDQELLVQGRNAVDHPIEKVSAGLVNSMNTSAKRKRDTQIRTPTNSDSDSAGIRETGRSAKRRATVEMVPGVEAEEVEIKREEEGYDSDSSDDR
ncbi:hypothetical protein LTR95_008306 [Oleoguttula sp. CCFEE 5521]